MILFQVQKYDMPATAPPVSSTTTTTPTASLPAQVGLPTVPLSVSGAPLPSVQSSGIQPAVVSLAASLPSLASSQSQVCRVILKGGAWGLKNV